MITTILICMVAALSCMVGGLVGYAAQLRRRPPVDRSFEELVEFAKEQGAAVFVEFHWEDDDDDDEEFSFDPLDPLAANRHN